jgi:predicted dehydrogenase
MHIHDIDVALWWFGRPRKIDATGREEDGLPLIVDAIWSYDDGLTAHLHSAWDRNGGAFRHGFKLIMEKATLIYDRAADANSLIILRGGKETALPMDTRGAHQAELDDFAQCLAQGREMTRITPDDSRAAVEVGLEELHQFTS